MNSVLFRTDKTISPAPGSAGDSESSSTSAGLHTTSPALFTLPANPPPAGGSEDPSLGAQAVAPRCSFVLYRVCAWCQKPMGTKATIYQNAGEITHGICPECFENLTGVPWDQRNAA